MHLEIDPLIEGEIEEEAGEVVTTEMIIDQIIEINQETDGIVIDQAIEIVIEVPIGKVTTDPITD